GAPRRSYRRRHERRMTASRPAVLVRPASRRAAWLLGPVLALALLPSNVVATALPLLRGEWHATATEMGIVFAAYQVGYVAAVLLVLPLTDRVAAGRVIAACFAATAAAFLLFPLGAHGVWSAAALRVLAGVGLAGVYLPGVRVMAAAAPPERRGLAVSAYVSAFYLGAAISLWATGALLPSLGWRGAGYLLGAICALGLPLAIVATWGTPPPDGRAARLSPGVLRDAPIARTIAADSGIYSTAITELAPPELLGSAQAAQAFLGFLMTVLAPVVAGQILDLGGGFGGAFALGGVAGLAGALALLPLARKQ